MDRKGPHRRAFFYSPGWTRTNNPPVNSRMLCQLSYRGSLGQKSLAKLGLDLAERVVDLGEHALELDRAGEVVAGEVRQLAPDETLLEPEKELARKYGVLGTPTIQFLPDRPEAVEGKRGRAVEVVRMPGYFKPEHFIAMFEYVAERGYERAPFAQYLKARNQKL